MNDDVDALRARLAAIVDSSQDAILSKNLEGIVTAWNRAAEHMYGYSATEMIGRHVSRIIPPHLVGESDFILGEVLEGRPVAAYDTERLAKDGSLVAVSVAVSPMLDGSGTVIGASTIARDIRERKKAEAERTLMQQLVEQSADAIIAVDSRERISTWNPAAEVMFGFTAAEAVGRLAREVVIADDPAEQVEVTSAVFSERQTLRYEARRRRRDGAELVADISIAPLADPSGAPAGAVVTVRDVTAAHEAEAAIQHAAERETQLRTELEQARRLESVGQLAGGIAHDFNNLLAVILNLAVFVADALPPESEARADAEEIEQTARRAATLTRQLLIFSRRGVIQPEIFDPADVLAGLNNFLRRALGELVDLEVETDQDPWNVEMDRGQLEQVIVNLAVNARDAMPDGGRLIVGIRNTVVDDAFARTRVGLEPGRYVTLTVSDTGVGMPPEVKQRVFEPFFTTKPAGQGTGLGLATVYGIVTDAGGRVTVYSEEGQGTAVHVYLPATAAKAGERVRDAAAPPGGGERILVVEDAPDVRMICARILRRAGYDVKTAGDASEALEVLRSAQVDLVLTDVVMPHTTGTSLAAQLRKDRPNAKVLYMSGYSHRMLDNAELDSRNSSFIEKPFTAADLQTRIRELLDR